MFPSLYISHGAPLLAVMEHEVSSAIKKLGKSIDVPQFIIVVSAHWQSKELRVLGRENPSLLYDFYGFPKELYEIEYPIENDLSIVNLVQEKLTKDGLHPILDTTREGYDHGVWVPLSLLYPKHKIPVVQISLPQVYSPRELLQLGESLNHFRDRALIIASGNMTHNLHDIVWDVNAPTKEYAKKFRDWVVKRIEKGDTDALLNFLDKAPYARQNHPTLEHFLPLFVALGASNDKKGESLLESYMYGNQAMDIISFEN